MSFFCAIFWICSFIDINKFCEFHTGIGQGGRIIIEDDCDIAMGVKFICETHEMCNGGGKTSR